MSETLCESRDCNLIGSSVLGISQARILEWVAISCSRVYVFFGEMSFQVPFPFLIELFAFPIELYELLVYFGNSLLVFFFAVIFSHSEGCLFTLFIVSFAVQYYFSTVEVWESKLFHQYHNLS